MQDEQESVKSWIFQVVDNPIRDLFAYLKNEGQAHLPSIMPYF